MLKNATVEVEIIHISGREIKFIFGYDTEDVLCEGITIGCPYFFSNPFKQRFPCTVRSLDLEFIIFRIVGYPHKSVVKLLCKIRLLYPIYKCLDGIFHMKDYICRMLIIEGIQFIVFILKDFLYSFSDLFSKLIDVIHEFIVEKFIEKHGSDDYFLTCLI